MDFLVHSSAQHAPKNRAAHRSSRTILVARSMSSRESGAHLAKANVSAACLPSAPTTSSRNGAESCASGLRLREVARSPSVDRRRYLISQFHSSSVAGTAACRDSRHDPWQFDASAWRSFRSWRKCSSPKICAASPILEAWRPVTRRLAVTPNWSAARTDSHPRSNNRWCRRRVCLEHVVPDALSHVNVACESGCRYIHRDSCPDDPYKRQSSNLDAQLDRLCRSDELLVQRRQGSMHRRGARRLELASLIWSADVSLAAGNAAAVTDAPRWRVAVVIA